MRRLLGASVLVVVLGASDVSYLVIHGGEAPTDTVAAAVSSREGAPRPASGPLAETASSSIPPTFLADPLRFLSVAPADSLDMLPGIGPVLASRVVDARRARGSFTSWDDVLDVRGIGPKTIARLQALASRR